MHGRDGSGDNGGSARAQAFPRLHRSSDAYDPGLAQAVQRQGRAAGVYPDHLSALPAEHQVLSGLQKEYGPRGLQILAAAFNTKAETLVPGFIHQFQPTFPVGWASHQEVLTYLDHSVMTPLYVPSMVFIDRTGVIRHEYLGGDPFYNNQEKNLRDTIEEMLKSPPVSAKK